MDSPETNNKITTTSSPSDSPLVQESPFFNYLRNLSPINPVKATSHISQVFPELSIPPPAPVFTSPRLNPQSEATFRNRSNYSQSIEHEDKGHTLSVSSDVFEQPISGVTVGLVSCTQKGCKAKDLLQSPSCSPSGSVDEYLADPLEADDKNSSDPSDSCLYQVDDRPEVLQSGEFETMAKVHVVDKTLQYTERGDYLEPGKMTNSERLIEYPKKTIDINLPESSPELASAEESVSHVDTQSVEGGHEGDRYRDSQESPEALQISESARVKSHEPAENNIANLEEVGQHHRGTRRRCLQFEASGGHKKIIINRGYSNPAIISRSSRVSANSTDLEMLESPELDVAAPSCNSAANSSPLMAYKLSLGSAKTRETNVDKFDSSTWNSGNSSKKIPLPSGIGLHLNSIVNTAAMGVQKEIPASATKYALPLTVVGKFPAMYGDPQESCSPSQPFYDNADNSQEFIQASPQNKRKSTDISEDEGCKHCNCKRSKCLKLYCECFAAGIYCAEPCTCQECYNKPEFIDMVFETRRIIESRNPLAFAPKIIHRATDSPANIIEENNKVTPASARHKRGCNCKKSMCLKKYCECYQAGVGCSAGCRCNGCKNPFGCKEEYGEMADTASRKVDGESWEVVSDRKLTRPEHRQTRNLTPITPTFQCSNHRKDALKSQFPARRYLPSPESDTNISSSQSPNSPRRIDLNNHIVFDQEVEFSATGRMDQFSPKWDRFEDICSLTPLSSKAASPSNNNSGQGRVQLQGSIRLSGSLRWRSSPITPLPRLGESKVQIGEPDSEPGYDILEDDTPDILKESRTPIKAVKVSSPNQKRVSPPCSHLNSLGSSRSSPGLKSGRKFVLQSISSFPPLTPYVDPKDNNAHK
ncbi:hypothetical protein ACHQM5_029172 [Ranunculus cassubicifolius]